MVQKRHKILSSMQYSLKSYNCHFRASEASYENALLKLFMIPLWYKKFGHYFVPKLSVNETFKVSYLKMEKMDLSLSCIDTAIYLH